MRSDDRVEQQDSRPLKERLLDGVAPDAVRLAELCIRSAAVIDCTGVALRLTSDWDAAVAEASDTTAARAADLEATLGEGPTYDALHLHRPVVSSDLRADERWPELASAAASLDYRAAASVPLMVESTQIGALTAYYRQATTIDDPTLAHIRHVARVLTGIVLGLPVQVPSGLATAVSTAAAHQARVHQAAGIISVDEGCTVEEAMIRLRAYAYADDRPLADVADDVVGRGLRLT